MSVLVVGISHRSAPVAVLERLALDGDGAVKLAHDAVQQDHVSEAAVIATCNRVEIYCDVTRFHGSVEVVSRLLCEQSGADPEEFLAHLYVHYDDGAVAHLFQVTSGLDSMVVGEAQILGQTRDGLRAAQEAGTVGPSLNLLFQQALRVGKRSHAETDIDRFAPSLVSASLERAAEHIGDVSGKQVLVVGAGSLASLAVATASRAGAEVTVANRTHAHGTRLAHEYGARAVDLAGLYAEIGSADVLVSCTGATSLLITADQIAAARFTRQAPLTVVDLALPHDVDPATADVPGVSLINLETLSAELRDTEGAGAVSGVRCDRRPRSCRRSSPLVVRPASPRPWWPCGAWPRESSRPRWPGSTTACPPSTRRLARRSSTPSDGWPTSCCTSRRCGSRSWPTPTAPCRTPPRWPSSSPSTPRPSRP